MAYPVVFIHGLFQMLRDLPAAGCLAPVPVLIPDLPGYGERQNVPPDEVSVESAAACVREEMRAAGFEKAHIVGHSVGGAVAVLLAHRYPEVVASLIDVEGNFTLKDAFWSGQMARMSVPEVQAVLDGYRADVDGWLRRGGIEPTAARAAIARRGFDAQPAGTIRAMARSVVEVTAEPAYLDYVREILDRGTTLQLLAGERSRAGWDVPAFVESRAAGMSIQPGVGHMMMLEDAPGFLRIIAGLVAASRAA